MARPRLALLLAFAACSPEVAPLADALVVIDAEDLGPDPNDGARSGSRLKLTWFELADGARQWDGFYDAQRKETCYIYEWADGKSYCAPDYDGSLLYSNGTCTQGAIEVYRDTNCGTTPAPYAMEYQYTPCESKAAHLFARGSKLSLAQYYYKSSTGACEGPYTTDTAYYDYYAVATEVKTTELVELELGAPIGTGRLATRYYESADGMRLQGAVHDAALGTTCSPRTYVGNDGLCAPSARSASYNEDAACTKPKLSISKQCAAPKFAIDYPSPYCATTPPPYYTLGALVAGSPLYTSSGTSCIAATPSTTSNYYRVGEQVELAPVRRTIASDGQRIKLVHYTNADGLSFRSPTLFDSQKDADCFPTKLPDGTIRCVVSGGYTQSFFKDTACMQSIDVLVASTGTASCPGPATPKFARKFVAPPAGSCTYGQQIFPVGAAYTGTLYQDVGTCQVYTPPTNYTVYSIGAEVPLTDFVAASLSIDP